MTLTLSTIKKTLFDRYYGYLNEMQREAVYAVNGPLLVVAGAGSGKTTVLVNRIAHIIKFGDAVHSSVQPELVSSEVEMLRQIASDEDFDQRDILEPLLACFASDPCPPDRILAITFTNKAAGEIKERLKKELGDRASEIWAGTFHSVCVRLLRRFSDQISYSGSFLIYDQDDCKKIITNLLKENEIDDPELTPRYLMSLISRAKNALQDASKFSELNQNSEKRRICAEIYTAYQKTLTDADAMDFDDIILETVRLLQNNAEVRAWCQRKFRYILVDEYQDTNRAQSILLKLIAGDEPAPNIMAVGDDDQSIYKFRGAAVENILSFDKEYPNTKVVMLEQNYRSTKSILDAANALIAHNGSRRGKTLWCAGATGKKVAVRQLEDQEKEAVYIADKIGFLTMQKLYQYGDFAVLYRTKAQSNALETVFTKSGIPHRLLSGLRFLDRAEVKDVVAYLRLVANPADTVSLSRVINVPRRSIGQATVDKVISLAKEENVTAFEILSRADHYEELKRSAVKLNGFYDLIRSLRAYAKDASPSEILQKVLDRTGYLDTLQGDENEEKRQNVQELFSSTKFYETHTDEPSLTGFLEDQALVSEIDNYDEAANAVVLMTVHAAKGLEFPVVFLTGMEENIFPSPRSTQNEADVEEERRLAYVAMTRAKNELFITFTQHRMLYGHTNFNELSRFIREIPDKYLDVEWCKTQAPIAFGDRDDFFLPPRRIPQRQSAPVRERSAPPKPSHRPSPAAAPARSAREKFRPGDLVAHPSFGDGQIVSAKDYGSDTLYEIRFANGATKKLMATYANLSKK
ncbi:MAG: UvrD-helicase domain-containing protein [Clostridia bacterium]|nr:UvrD-helicase domain-containing protein [Clostridia bacterium]